MPNHTGRLVLTTVDPFAEPDAAPLAAALAACGFIGAPLTGRHGSFAVGPRFLELLTFSGCAVRIAAAPGDSPESAFSYVELPPPAPFPRLLWGRNTRPPRCPACRERLADWRRLIRAVAASLPPEVVCPRCGAAQPPWAWDWKEQGGFGRRFVLIEEVFPGEALPTPRLLGVLSDAGGSGWRHFFVQD
jgi:hypothetical protein